ncbi:MAG: adenylate kinase [Lentisphaeria bacterium]|jgi:adenylate kinase
MPKNCIFIGAPGAGKGTMAEMMVAAFGTVHISTGDLLRAEMKAGTALGGEARRYIDQGLLVPDAVVAGMVKVALASAAVRSRGFLLDGYPRTLPQAELLDQALAELGLRLDAVLLLEVDRDLLLRRLTSRRLCRNCPAIYNLLSSPPRREGVCDQCGGALYQRSDDTLETVRQRLTVYETQTAPLVERYGRQGILARIHGGGNREENFAGVRQALGL